MDGTVVNAGWVAVGQLSDVPVRGARVLRIGGLEIGIFRTSASEVFAIDNRCPHKQGPLSEGIVHDNAVTCPLHNWVIELSSGKARGADEGCVTSYPAEIRDGDKIFVQVPAA